FRSDSARRWERRYAPTSTAAKADSPSTGRRKKAPRASTSTEKAPCEASQASRKESGVPPSRMRSVGASPIKQPSTTPPTPSRVARRGHFEKTNAVVPANTWRTTATSRTSMLLCHLSDLNGGRSHARLHATYFSKDCFACVLAGDRLPELGVV